MSRVCSGAVRVAGVVASIVWVVSGPSLAVADPLWGVQTVTGIGDIFLSGGQNNFTFDGNGGVGVPVASSLVDDAVTRDFFGQGPHNRGVAEAFGGLKLTNNQVPVLKTRAVLTGNLSNQPPAFGSFVNGAVGEVGVFASEMFRYTGSVPTTLNLTFTLEGMVSDTPDDVLTGIFGEAAVFHEGGYQFFADLGTLIFEFGATPKQSNGVEAVDTTSLVISGDTGGNKVTRTTTLAFDVQPNEVFYVWEKLDVFAVRGARSADAFSTMTAEFDQPGLVVALSVPEPASLMLIGAAGAWGLTRRRV